MFLICNLANFLNVAMRSFLCVKHVVSVRKRKFLLVGFKKFKAYFTRLVLLIVRLSRATYVSCLQARIPASSLRSAASL